MDEQPSGDVTGCTVDLRGATGVQVGDNPQMHLHVRSGRPPWWTRSGYIEQVRDIAPGCGLPGALRDRDAELAELAAFSAGDEEYLWFRAKPWAGKSALLSTFVLNPPPQVEVVSFFITARLAAQSDSTAFTDMLIDQLSAIVGEGVPGSLTPAAKDAHRRALLRAATDKLGAEGRRLVLVVDGLDEDCGGQPGSGLPSVASLLPKVCGNGLRVVVTSRPDPHLPDDVPADHPLRRGSLPRELAVSPYAVEVAERAARELQDLLHADHLHQDILGLITACGGGLTLTELEELTAVPPYRLEALLGGVFGRTVAGRTDHTATDSGTLYLFTHETLRETVTRHLGSTVSGYRDRLHSWADRYRMPAKGQSAWPKDTPQYLLRGYVRMLIDLADTDRLVALATDSVRHDLMLSLSGGDAAALIEIRACQDLLLAQANFTESAVFNLTRLSYQRGKIEARNSTIPPTLPAVWAQLGHPARAEALARGFADLYMQTRALAEVVRGLGRVGDYNRAERIARSIDDPGEQARALAALVWVLAGAGAHGHAERIARDIAVPKVQCRALARLAQTLFGAGEHLQAERIVCSTADSQMRARARRQEPIELAWDSADPGEDDWTLKIPTCEQAELVWRDLVSVSQGQESVEGFKSAWAELIDFDFYDLEDQPQTLGDLLQTLADPHESNPARRPSRDFVRPYERAWSLTRRALSLAEIGESDRARHLAMEAERVARDIIDPNEQVRALIRLALSLVEIGESDRVGCVAEEVERIARDIRDVSYRLLARMCVVHLFSQANKHGLAEKIALDIVRTSDHDVLNRVLGDLTQPFSEASELGQARHLVQHADQYSSNFINIDAPARVTTFLARDTSQREQTQQWIDETERAAHDIADLNERASALTELAAAVGLPRAGRLLGKALALGPWHQPLAVLAELYPQVVFQIADVVCGDTGIRRV